MNTKGFRGVQFVLNRGHPNWMDLSHRTVRGVDQFQMQMMMMMISATKQLLDGSKQNAWESSSGEKFKFTEIEKHFFVGVME